MRKNFAQVLKAGKVDIQEEYHRIYNLFYDEVYINIDDEFMSCPFRGTCTSVEDFNEAFGFSFEEYPPDFSVDYLISFCEYCYNFGIFMHHCSYDEGKTLCMQIDLVIEKIGYMQAEEDGIVIFVEKSAPAIAVSEIVPTAASYSVISYNHYSMKGDLESKKEILLKLAYLLEPKDSTLESLDKTFKKDLFYLFNNLGLRHNNLDPDGKKYKEFVAQMKPGELEHWYDETYQMCLLAFLRLDHIARKKDFDVLKSKIEGIK